MNFSFAVLQGANFRNANFDETRLDGADCRGADFTATFRALSGVLRGKSTVPATLIGGDGVAEWLLRWRAVVADTGRDEAETAKAMDEVNPLYIPRNHLVDEALAAATEGDLEPFRRLYAIVTSPYREQQGAERFAEPAPAAFNAGFQTYCGT